MGLAGAVVFACGAGLVAWSAVGDIEGPLELPRAEKRLMLPVGRFGIGGRGAAIALVGFYLVLSAVQGDASQARELGGALRLRAPGALRRYCDRKAFALAFIGSSVLDFVAALYRRFDLDIAGPKRRRRRATRRSSG